MNNQARRKALIAIGLFITFLLWTIGVSLIDVQPIGPEGTTVGFATLNQFVHKSTGVHMVLYVITDWLGLVPICFAIGFSILGLCQWIGRRKIGNVDFSLWILGGFYIVVVASYLIFENVIINYRPILIDGNLEVSYPSSTTLLVICVMYTAMLQLQDRIQNKVLNRCTLYIIKAFIAFMVIGRFISGVHWFSDIIGGILLSISLIQTYQAAIIVGTRVK